MGIGFKARIRGFKFDKGGFIGATERAAKSAVYSAAKEWLRAVIVRVPIWSGQALGSVKYAVGRSGNSSGLFLGEYLKQQIPIQAYHWKANKNPQTGGVQGRYTFSQSRHQYRFTFQTDVIYYVIQDFFNIKVSPRAPWGSMDAGAAAFNAAIGAEMASRLPRVNDFLLDSEILQGES